MRGLRTVRRASAGRILPERNVGPNLIVIGRVFRKDSPKVLGVEHLSVPKIRFCNNGDEVHRGQGQMRCGLRAGWRDGSERLCQETDESSTHYNRRHTSSESGVSALRPRQPCGRRTRVGSIRSVFRRSRSAKARPSPQGRPIRRKTR
jgi:hypothetical protein